MSGKDIKVECSIVVCSYNPDWEKLRLTLKSILMQKNCNYEIIISDDGSSDNLFCKIKAFFLEQKFDNYALVTSTNNRGTVHNVLQGVRVSVGEFIKLISPGDFLHGKCSLRQWIDFMYSHNDYVMSYCDAIYYHWKNGEIKPIRERSNPQSIKPDIREYILHEDLCLGASTLVRRQGLVKYLEVISGKVIYAEDFSYRVMLYCGEKIINMPKSCLLYEYGTGISTCNSQLWKERLETDDASVREIMVKADACAEAIKLKVADYLKIPQKRSWYSRYKRYKSCPSKFIYRLKREFFPRRTPIDIDTDFIRELLMERK